MIMRVRPRSLGRLLRAVAADLLGHRETFFRALRGIAQGDTIRVRSRRRLFLYTDSMRIVPGAAPGHARHVRTDAYTPNLLLIRLRGSGFTTFRMQARMAAAEMERSVHRSSAEIRA